MKLVDALNGGYAGLYGEVVTADIYNRAVLATIDYICMEIHPYALHGAELPKVLAAQDKAIEELKLTHHCKRDGVHLWAIKK